MCVYSHGIKARWPIFILSTLILQFFQLIQISDLESPVKHNSFDSLTPEHAPQNVQLYEDKTRFSGKDVQPISPHIAPHCSSPQLPNIESMSNPYTSLDNSITDNATICVGLNVSKPSRSKNLETVIESLNSQLDVLNTEIRDEINELSTLSPSSPAKDNTCDTNISNAQVSGSHDQVSCSLEKCQGPDSLDKVFASADKVSSSLPDKVSGSADEVSESLGTVSESNDASQSKTALTSKIFDCLFPEKSASSSVETVVNSPQGLTIEELEPIIVAKPMKKTKRNATQKEDSKRKKNSDVPSVISGEYSLGSSSIIGKPGNSNTEPSQPGETDFLSDLQRALTSNIRTTSTQPKKCRAPRILRKNASVPMISLDERDQKNSQPSAQEDPTMNSKLLTELQRLLTQNNIRSALQSEKKKIKCTRPSLDSPPYIRPPQAHDSSSMDGSRFFLDKPKMFPCQQCNKEFKTKQCLKRHISRHLGVKLHVCSYCSKRFNDKSNLKRHVVTHINLKKFLCDVCDQAFFRKEVMELHKRRIHTVQSDVLNCRFKKCNFSCNVPFQLVDHIQTIHFKNYRYNCDKCRYRTQHNFNFVKHLRVHSGERPYKCAKCGKAFKQPNALKKHSEVHLDRPHKCEICLKTFCLEVALRIHYENNHGPRAAQKKLQEKKKREILRKYREQHSKKISFVNVMTNL